MLLAASSSDVSLPLRLNPTTHRHKSTHISRVSYPRRFDYSSTLSSPQWINPVTPPRTYNRQEELRRVQPHPVAKMLPLPVQLAASAALVAAALSAGGAAVLGSAAVAAAAYALRVFVPKVAATELRNYITSCDDPGAVKREDIARISDYYGVSNQDEAFNAERSNIYTRFVQSVIPPGSEELDGSEAEKIIQFKSALGIDDPEAAAIHFQVAKWIFRYWLETINSEARSEAFRQLEKLIYVSTLVFGEASDFLSPWKRIFRLTDSQVETAIHYNSKSLYASKLKTIGIDVTTDQLISLREAQLAYRLPDEIAEDSFKERSTELVEENVSAALTALKSSADVAEMVERLDRILAFNDLLTESKNYADAYRFAPGVGPVSLIGTDIDDLKLLYKAYAEDAVSSGRIESDKLEALNQLGSIFNLPKCELEAVRLDVTSKSYARRLAQAVSSGQLDAAGSKASFLQNMCEELHLLPKAARKIHEEIYRVKLQRCAADGELSDEKVKDLLRLRVLLCIPQKTVESAHSDICGSLFGKVVKKAIASGVDRYDAEARKSVRAAMNRLRLSKEAALSTLGKTVRRVFIDHIKRARAARDSTESARELKEMIIFNMSVVTELVADLKGESCDKASEEERYEDEEWWESLQTLGNTRLDKAELRKRGQTDINVKDDLSERDREDVYKTYLLHSRTGDAADDGSDYVLLNQLAGILGLTSKQAVQVHHEQAFRQQVEEIFADGKWTEAKTEQVDEVQMQLGLSRERAQKVMKTNTKMAEALGAAVLEGRLKLEQIRELNELNAHFVDMIREPLREKIFRETIEEMFTSGTGEFSAEEVYEKLPADLNLNAEKARGTVRENAKRRLYDSLVQAVSLLRQRKHQEAVPYLNNLLACDKAETSEPLRWRVPQELADLFAIYRMSDPTPENLSRLQYLLRISDSEAATMRDTRDTTTLPGEAEEELFEAEEEFPF